VDEQLHPAVDAARHTDAHGQQRQHHQAGAGAAGAADVGPGADDVPRVRPRAARALLDGPLSAQQRHRPRLRRISVAAERALGVRSRRLRQLREALPDRRADAAGARGEDQEGAHLQSGIRDDREPGRIAARPGVAHAFRRRPAAERERVRSRRAEEVPRRRAAGAAALSQPVLLPHLEQRLLSAVLLVPLDRGARRRRVRLVHGARRDDAGERRSVPLDDPVARRTAGFRGALSGVPGAGSAGRTPAAGARPRRQQGHEDELATNLRALRGYRARTRRNALATTITVAPVSASTAIQSVARPAIASARNAAFRHNEIATLVFTLRIVARARRSA